MWSQQHPLPRLHTDIHAVRNEFLDTTAGPSICISSAHPEQQQQQRNESAYNICTTFRGNLLVSGRGKWALLHIRPNGRTRRGIGNTFIHRRVHSIHVLEKRTSAPTQADVRITRRRALRSKTSTIHLFSRTPSSPLPILARGWFRRQTRLRPSKFQPRRLAHCARQRYSSTHALFCRTIFCYE